MELYGYFRDINVNETNFLLYVRQILSRKHYGRNKKYRKQG